ncbi:MAG: cytochrome-c peroxidase [bacterium]|nr:cytochrome-c peroxidase [bacterium]
MKNQTKWNIAFLLVIAVMLIWFFLGYRVQDPDPTESIEKEELAFDSKEDFGKALFFDPRLSSDISISCANCHQPELAFTDGLSKSEGVGGKLSFRNASTLLNVKDAPVFMFDAHIQSLEEQAIVPIQDTNEMNMPMGELIKRLNKVPHYVDAAKQLYNRDLDAWVVTRALASFQRTLVSQSSEFDQYLAGEGTLAPEVKRGWELFNELQCIECHSLPNFTNYTALNNGLYVDYGNDQGKYRIAGDSSKMGAFKVPSLRNVALTAPYMHDGSMQTLEEVLEHYSKGGVGGTYQDDRVTKRDLTQDEKKYLITFLGALTDTSYLRDFR